MTRTAHRCYRPLVLPFALPLALLGLSLGAGAALAADPEAREPQATSCAAATAPALRADPAIRLERQGAMLESRGEALQARAALRGALGDRLQRHARREWRAGNLEAAARLGARAGRNHRHARLLMARGERLQRRGAWIQDRGGRMERREGWMRGRAQPAQER